MSGLAEPHDEQSELLAPLRGVCPIAPTFEQGERALEPKPVHPLELCIKCSCLMQFWGPFLAVLGAVDILRREQHELGALHGPSILSPSHLTHTLARFAQARGWAVRNQPTCKANTGRASVQPAHASHHSTQQRLTRHLPLPRARAHGYLY